MNTDILGEFDTVFDMAGNPLYARLISASEALFRCVKLTFIKLFYTLYLYLLYTRMGDKYNSV